MAAKPQPKDCFFSAVVERQLYIYGGYLGAGNSELPTTVHVFSCDTEKWIEITTTGEHPPPNLHHGACTSQDHLIFLYGGYDGHDRNNFCNNLYQLDLKDFKWTQLSSSDDQGAPLAKRGHSMIYHAPSASLLVFGGRGLLPLTSTQPGAMYQDYCLGEVHTDELHMFNLKLSEP